MRFHCVLRCIPSWQEILLTFYLCWSVGAPWLDAALAVLQCAICCLILIQIPALLSEEVMFCQLAAVLCSKEFHWVSLYAHWAAKSTDGKDSCLEVVCLWSCHCNPWFAYLSLKGNHYPVITNQNCNKIGSVCNVGYFYSFHPLPLCHLHKSKWEPSPKARKCGFVDQVHP